MKVDRERITDKNSTNQICSIKFCWSVETYI